jgi:hypothetical protein
LKKEEDVHNVPIKCNVESFAITITRYSSYQSAVSIKQVSLRTDLSKMASKTSKFWFWSARNGGSALSAFDNLNNTLQSLNKSNQEPTTWSGQIVFHQYGDQQPSMQRASVNTETRIINTPKHLYTISTSDSPTQISLLSKSSNSTITASSSVQQLLDAYMLFKPTVTFVWQGTIHRASPHHFIIVSRIVQKPAGIVLGIAIEIQSTSRTTSNGNGNGGDVTNDNTDSLAGIVTEVVNMIAGVDKIEPVNEHVLNNYSTVKGQSSSSRSSSSSWSEQRCWYMVQLLSDIRQQ